MTTHMRLIPALALSLALAACSSKSESSSSTDSPPQATEVSNRGPVSEIRGEFSRYEKKTLSDGAQKYSPNVTYVRAQNITLADLAIILENVEEGSSLNNPEAVYSEEDGAGVRSSNIVTDTSAYFQQIDSKTWRIVFGYQFVKDLLESKKSEISLRASYFLSPATIEKVFPPYLGLSVDSTGLPNYGQRGVGFVVIPLGDTVETSYAKLWSSDEEQKEMLALNRFLATKGSQVWGKPISLSTQFEEKRIGVIKVDANIQVNGVGMCLVDLVQSLRDMPKDTELVRIHGEYNCGVMDNWLVIENVGRIDARKYTDWQGNGDRVYVEINSSIFAPYKENLIQIDKVPQIDLSGDL